jgi:hypothetical protein
MSVRLSACIGVDFQEIGYWGRESAEELRIWLKSDNTDRKCTLGSSTKWFVAQQQCSWKPFLRFHGNIQRFYIVASYM